MLGQPDADRRDSAREIGSRGACNHVIRDLLCGTNAEERLFGEHEGAQVQAGLGGRRNPVTVDGDQFLDALKEVRYGKFGQGHTGSRGLQATSVGVGAEGVQAAVSVTVDLQSLKDFLTVVQNRGGGVQFDGTVGLNAGTMPAALLAPAHVDHVVGEVVTKARVRQNCGTLGLGFRLEVAAHKKLK